MTKQEFIRRFEEVLGVDAGAVTAETVLDSIEQWDSVAYLSTLVLIDDEFGINLLPDALRSAQVVGDIVKLVEAKFRP